MAPGLTNREAAMEEFKKGDIVSIFANTKSCAYAIGKAAMGSKKILEKGKGVAIEILHKLNDGLWHLDNDIKINEY